MSEAMTKERALQILKSRKIINGVGKYQVKVNSVHPHEDKYIVNIGAMNLYQAKQARTNLTAEKFEDAANSNLSFSVFEGQPCPKKGEIINVFIDEIGLKIDGELTGETAFLVSSWIEIAVSTGIASFNFETEAAEAVEDKVKKLSKSEF